MKLCVEGVDSEASDETGSDTDAETTELLSHEELFRKVLTHALLNALKYKSTSGDEG
eukprot:CAMPEP_0185584952 /NCGR_PEP_ID=MMETSP0434-20130131/35539_1 /TAXON_ID=626734 ORGANISM="Favella taraikaensis, Strain Fe Narragansett Bay" /NCGR_SAMPLE_ID=MMETSP0434 /ASSEMBLY_ACC=CAM_ASM_000379 /LENGTH=56 /DNA_ID=CAMNT_0028205009 /DNA_START=862 /DNA_END=1032 /DNA_ORIENTATION=+